MAHARLMRLAGASVAGLHLTCGLLGWLAFGLPGSMLLFGLCGVVTLGLALAAAPLLDPPPRDHGGAPDHSGNDAPEPPWWPEFERALREHSARERSPA